MKNTNMNASRKLIILTIIAITLAFFSIIVSVVLFRTSDIVHNEEDEGQSFYAGESAPEKNTMSEEETSGTSEQIFSAEPIPEEVRTRMWNVTISENSLVSFDDLRYLTITFWGYDGESQVGNMIVSASLAEEVLNIFEELYQVGFPIEKMRLPCEYGGIDEASMSDNNTSAFNDRPLNAEGGLSYHQLGTAIDINPLYNPYINLSTLEVQPKDGEPYLDRENFYKGMILPDSDCVKIFKKYGWIWGGDWNSVKDYQHFEKHL